MNGFKPEEEIKIEMQLIMNRNLYENAVIEKNMYNFISDKLNKLLHIKKNKIFDNISNIE